MKKIGLALLCLLMACGVSAMVLYGIWNQYNPTAIIGSSIQTENTDVKEVTEQWFDEFFKQYEGPFVPFEFRIRDKSCLLYTSPSPRDKRQSRMPSSA